MPTPSIEELAKLAARREAQLILKTARGDPMSNDHMIALFASVTQLDKTLGIVAEQTKMLKETLLGNGQPGKCKEHEQSIGALRSEVDLIRGRRSVLIVVVAMVVAFLSSCATGIIIKLIH